MHSVIENGLEDFLAGVSGGEDRVRIEAHLKECAGCRAEVKAMREMSELFSTLRSSEAPEPASGFYARVVNRIESQRPVSFWSSLLQPAFGRRMALASLLALATLGTVLVSREADYSTGPSPEMILAAEREAPAAIDRDQMLFTLVSHHP
jgi:predicted anti-sigma-YlaC factor YlaD